MPAIDRVAAEIHGHFTPGFENVAKGTYKPMSEWRMPSGGPSI
jgi:hypothetical protein